MDSRPIAFRVTELARISGVGKPAVSMALKGDNNASEKLELAGGKIVGILPETVEEFLLARGKSNLAKSALIVLSTQTGGCGKTSSCINLAAAARRMTSRKSAIVMIDADSQASLSLQASGAAANDDDPILLSWIEGKVKLATDLLTPVGENVWLVRSNLNNAFLDRAMGRPQLIKTAATKLVRELIDHFGPGTKVLVDTPPQLSSVGQSFIVATAAMRQDEIGTLLVPIRLDDFGVKGAQIAIGEANEVVNAFFNTSVKALCFVNGFDQRTKNSVRTLSAITRNPVLNDFLAPVAIRHSSEVARAIARRSSVFTDYKNASTIGADYIDLLLSALGCERDERETK